jgi:hypothetical protein
LVREQVLKEFNHRCAFCGEDRPQVHHIDGHPENNNPLNLLPLCPNHHLTDLHDPNDPTQPIQPLILFFFRRYRDPAILSPQFVPLFNRIRFLYEWDPTAEPAALEECINDLVSFVGELETGTYYAAAIRRIFGDPPPGILGYMAHQAGQGGTYDAEYRDRIRATTPAVETLIVELLRFQDWKSPFVKKSGPDS